jgi:hypothetical protein
MLTPSPAGRKPRPYDITAESLPPIVALLRDLRQTLGRWDQAHCQYEAGGERPPRVLGLAVLRRAARVAYALMPGQRDTFRGARLAPAMHGVVCYVTLDPTLPLAVRAAYNALLGLADGSDETRFGPRRWWLDGQRMALLQFLDETIATFDVFGNGPVPPDGFRWQGRECQGLGHLPYLLLDYLWDQGGRLKSATFEDVCERVWGSNDVQAETIRTCVSRLDSKLSRDGICLGLGTKHGHVVCDWEE